MITYVDDDGNLILPPQVLEELDWKEGDTLEWIDLGDDKFQLRKVEDDGTSTDSE